MSSELPAQHRITPEAVRDYREQAGPCDGPELTVCSLVRGAFVSWLVFIPLLLVASGALDADSGFWNSDYIVLPLLMAGAAFFFVAFVGFPLGAFTAHLLRAQPQQWWHLAAFAGTGAVVGSLVTLVLYQAPWSFFVPLAALSAAAGRAVLWRRFVPRPRAVVGGTHGAARGAGEAQ